MLGSFIYCMCSEALTFILFILLEERYDPIWLPFRSIYVMGRWATMVIMIGWTGCANGQGMFGIQRNKASRH